MSELAIQGRINQKGQFITNDNGKLHEFFGQNKGRTAIMRVEAYIPNTRSEMKGYYYGKIVHDLQQIFLETGVSATIGECDLWLRSKLPCMYKQISLKSAESEIMDTEELSKDQWMMLIDRSTQLVAETFKYII